MSLFVSSHDHLSTECPEGAHLYVLVKELPTFQADLQKDLGGGLLSQTVPPRNLFLRVQASVQALDTRWRNAAALRNVRCQELSARCKIYKK